MRDTNVVIAIGSTAYSNEIKQKKISIDKLFDILSEPKIRKKKDGPYFIFASFKKNERNAFNVKFYYGATLDLDDTSLKPSQIRKVLRDLKVHYCFYSTHSHKAPDKGNRYRIVIPYKEPISKEKHAETTVYLNSLFGITGVDTSSKAISRPMYLPACPLQRKKDFYFYESKYNALLDPEKEIKIPAHLLWEMEELNNNESEKVDITEEIFEGGRNDHIARVTGTLIQQGKTLQEIIDFCDEINQLKFSPPMKSVELARTVKSVWKSHTRNHGDSDWGYEQILDRIKKTKSIEKDLDHLLTSIAVSMRKSKTSKMQSEKLLKEIKAKDRNQSISVLREELQSKKRQDKDDIKSSKTQLDIDPETDSPIIDKIRKEFKDFYFVSSQNLMYNQRYELFYKLEGFNNQFNYLKQDFGYTSLTPFRILDEIEALDKVDSVRYHPAHEKMYRDYNGMLCLNSYKKPSVKPFKGNVKPLLRHFKYLFPTEFEMNVVLDFIAYNYQNPGMKLDWTPIIKGRKGIGKSIISNYIMAPIFGHSNVRQLNNSQPLLKEFNSWQTDTQLVVIHELYLTHNIEIKKQVTENIKAFITDPFISVRKMHTDWYQQENVTNMMAFTNHEDVIYVTPDERRFCMIKCEVQPKGRAYYERLINYLTNNAEAVAHYFKYRKIETIDPHVLPVTKYTKEIMQASKNWAESILWEELGDDMSLLKTQKALTWTTICDIVLNRLNDGGSNVTKYENIYNAASGPGRMLRQALIEEDFRPYEFNQGQNRVRIDGHLEKIWITPFGRQKQFHKHTMRIVKHEAAKYACMAQQEFKNRNDE